MPPPPPAHQTDMDMYEVKRGDTLSKIAQKYKPADVSLEQMLVALFRDNPEAFAGKNMNRLKTGPLVSIPSCERSGERGRQGRKARSAPADGELERLQGKGGGRSRHGAPSHGRGRAGSRRQGHRPGRGSGALAQAQPKEVLKLSKGESRWFQGRPGSHPLPRGGGGGTRADDQGAGRARRQAREDGQGHAGPDRHQEPARRRDAEAGRRLRQLPSQARHAGQAEHAGAGETRAAGTASRAHHAGATAGGRGARAARRCVDGSIRHGSRADRPGQAEAGAQADQADRRRSRSRRAWSTRSSTSRCISVPAPS